VIWIQTSVKQASDSVTANGLVHDIEEVSYKPNHMSCASHWTFHVILKDGRRYAVNFTDRQLGWLPILQPWSDYLRERVALTDEGKRVLHARNGSTSLETVYDQEYEGKNFAEALWASGIGTKKERIRDDINFDNWPGECEHIPPNDGAMDEQPEDWQPDESLSQGEREVATSYFFCRIEEYIRIYFEAWRRGEWGR
jgi:hypothetical protein